MPQYCPACGVGVLLPTRRTYVTHHGETLVHSPDVPALKCDTCRLVIFDEDAIGRIELLIGQAGPPPNVTSVPARRPAEPTPAEAAPCEDTPDDSPRQKGP